MKVACVSAICLMALVVVLKNVLHVPATVLSRDIIIYIPIYSWFWMLTLIDGSPKKRSRGARPLYWNLLIVTVTLAIIGLYAI